MCGEAHSHKNSPNKEKSPKCANCRGPHVPNYRGCPAYKDQAFRQHVVQNQASYASIPKQVSKPPPSNTFNFTADQIVSLVTDVVIQVALPQLCTKTCLKSKCMPNPTCLNRLQKRPKECLRVNIESKDVFRYIISRQAPPLPAPFVFSSMLVEKKIEPFKASTVLTPIYMGHFDNLFYMGGGG